MNNKTFAYWYKLLNHFEKKNYISNGLTIPFLIGAVEVLQPNSEKWTISDIIESFQQEGCTILKCGNIGEFVIGTINDLTEGEKKYFHNPCGEIFVTDTSLDDVNSTSELIKIFTELYESKIQEAKFSKNYLGEWSYFSIKDIERIKESITQSV